MEFGYAKRDNSNLYDDFSKIVDLNGVQSYIPIYKRYFNLSENNFNSIELNHSLFMQNIIGKNTSTNIQSGVMFGAINSIEGMISMIQNEIKSELSIILTGGFSQLISSKLSYKHILKPNLTLDGIRLIYNDKSSQIS